MTAATLPIAVLISGTGRTLRNLIKRIAAGRLDAEIRLVISSNPRAGGLQYAAEANIPARVVQQSTLPDARAFRDAVFDPCREKGVELVVMAGFLKRVMIPEDFQQRVVNIHPALIPAFCGPGWYGRRVHEAAIRRGVKVSGCTIHFVDDQYDHGPIIDQRTVTVLPDDTAASLADRVFQVECEAYPEVLQMLAQRRVRVDGHTVRIGEKPVER